jgi:hypothetical protein
MWRKSSEVSGSRVVAYVQEARQHRLRVPLLKLLLVVQWLLCSVRFQRPTRPVG